LEADDYVRMMVRRALALSLIAGLVAAPGAAPAQSSASAAPALTAELRADLHCAAAFAVAASEQQRGTAAALALPPMAVRGKRFFADVGERVLREAGLSRDAVRDLLVADVAAMQRRATVDPDGELAVQVKPCLARLDETVPPLESPDLAQCAAILALAFDEERARDAQSVAARDLQTLAQVLASRARAAFIAGGATGDGADAALELAIDAMRAEARSRPGGVDNYAIAHCYDLAAPEAKSHY
jgi:hypothetical protein